MSKKSYLKTKDGKTSSCTTAMLEKAKQILSAGLTNNSVIKELKISRDTFYRWKREIPEFNEAIAEGKTCGEALNEERVLGMGLGQFKGNVAAMQMYMRNVYGWDRGVGDGSTFNQQINITQTNFLDGKTTAELLEYIQDVQIDVAPLLEYEEAEVEPRE